MIANPYQQYKEQSLITLAPGELLIKLFDELIKQLNMAVIAIQKGRLDTANASLSKGQEIITTLNMALDMRYPISSQLRPMYNFLNKQLMQANIKKDTKILEECIPLVKDLRESFDEAQKISRANSAHASIGGKAV